jgi:threonine dehydratase
MICDIDTIEAARAAIAGKVRHTPVMGLELTRSKPPTGARVSLKLECLQVTGSFKTRGAMNKLLATPSQEIAGGGIVTASGGNHGMAVAYCAYAAGVEATIFVPENVSTAKVKKMETYGATVNVGGIDWFESNAAALEFSASKSVAYFHPFADPKVVAGQGTLGLELLDDLPDADAILLAIGGGGLISGISTAIRARRPEMAIIGVEAEGAPTLYASLKAGKVVELDEITTDVPTLACRKTDPAIYETVARNVDDIVLVSDTQLLAGARQLWFETGVAADLAGAAAYSALMAGVPALEEARHICVLVCGAGAEGCAG